MKYIAFRADASSRIGTGHLMRCLTLAEAMRAGGHDVCFFSRHLPGALEHLLRVRGFEARAVVGEAGGGIAEADSLKHSEWLGVMQESDAVATATAMSGRRWDVLVVDHYALDARWEEIARRCANRLFVIDDIADREHECDVLLDQNFYEDRDTRYTGKVPVDCRMLLGPEYALLRSEFRLARRSAKPRAGKVSRVLVFFGGVDADNYTNVAITALARLRNRPFEVDVVIGAQHPFVDRIRESCEKVGFTCHVQTDRMADLMAGADLAIGACGSATWERCCVGLPAITVSVADNQTDIGRGLHFARCGVFLGSADSVGADALCRSVELLLDDPAGMAELSANAYALVDGLGADRVRAAVCS